MRRCAAVDILMNNAGVGLGAGFLDTPLEDWDWIVGINLKGVIHGCHYFVPPMVARGPADTSSTSPRRRRSRHRGIVGLQHDEVCRARACPKPCATSWRRTASV